MSEDVADPSPLEPGKFLIPAYATTVNPPVCDQGFVAVFNGKNWEVAEDKRGIYYFLEKGAASVFENFDPKNSPKEATKDPPPKISSDEDLSWDNGWVVTQKPTAPELTPAEKLEKAGLTVEDLKELLGLP